MRFCSFRCNERALRFDDWNAAATKPCSEILSICLPLGIFAIKSFSLSAVENFFLKIWSIFGSKTLSVRRNEPGVHPSFNLCFYGSSSSEFHLRFGSFCCQFFVCYLHFSVLVPLLLSLLCRFSFFPERVVAGALLYCHINYNLIEI